MCAADRDKTEVCPRGSENQAQYEYGFFVIKIVKLNVVERGMVSSSHREFDIVFVRNICTCAGWPLSFTGVMKF